MHRSVAEGCSILGKLVGWHGWIVSTRVQWAAGGCLPPVMASPAEQDRFFVVIDLDIVSWSDTCQRNVVYAMLTRSHLNITMTSPHARIRSPVEMTSRTPASLAQLCPPITWFNSRASCRNVIQAEPWIFL